MSKNFPYYDVMWFFKVILQILLVAYGATFSFHLKVFLKKYDICNLKSNNAIKI